MAEIDGSSRQIKSRAKNIAEDFVTYEARLLSLNQKTEDFKTFWKSFKMNYLYYLRIIKNTISHA